MNDVFEKAFGMIEGNLCASNIEHGTYYKYIANENNIAFINGLNIIKNKFGQKENKLKFLDVGCGYGFKLILSEVVGLQAFGIEVDSDYAGFANKLLKKELRIYHIDAFDFDDYDKFDIIYFYHPVKDIDKLNDLVNLIVIKMRVNSYLMPVFHFSANSEMEKLKKDIRLNCVDGFFNVFKKL